MPRLHHDEFYDKNSSDRSAHAQQVIEEAGCTTFDWAFPIDWCLDFVKKTGFDRTSGEIVWGYPATGIFGKPVALTHRAQEALELAAASTS